jgi:hypothetical protein
MAADGTGGSVYSWEGGNWSAPQLVDQIQGDDDGFTSMSCPTTTFCAAGAQLGYVYMYSEGLWSPGVHIDSSSSGGLAVSCTKADYCFAADGNGSVYTYAVGRWTHTSTITREKTFGLSTLSCPSKSFCVAGGISGKAAVVFTLSDGRWSKAHVLKLDVDNDDALGLAVSCSSAKFCMAADSSGYSYLLH